MERPFLAAFIAILLFLLSCSNKASYPPAALSGDEVRISLSGLKEGEPYFMSLNQDGRRVDFFVVKANGAVRSYFDACMRCYSKKLGYRKDGDGLVCRACDVSYPMVELDGIGGCYPVPVEGTVQGEAYVIEKEKILAGLKYF